MVEKIKITMMWIIALVVITAIGVGCFKLQRMMNWSLSYGSAVDEAIEERVAPLEARIVELELKLDNSE